MNKFIFYVHKYKAYSELIVILKKKSDISALLLSCIMLRDKVFNGPTGDKVVLLICIINNKIDKLKQTISH